MGRLKTSRTEMKFSSLVTLIVVIMVISENQTLAKHTTEIPAFFLKIAQSIPRMGRSDPQFKSFNENFNIDGSPKSDESEAQSKVFKRKVGFYADSGDSWKHFPLTIEGPPELWKTLAGYSDEHLYKSSNDFNNELWMRDKRTSAPEKK